MPSSEDGAERHAVQGQEAAVDRVVSDDPSVDLDQQEHGRTGTKMSPGRVLSDRVASEAQGDGGERNVGKPGRGSENYQAFVIAVETDETLEYPRFAVIEAVHTFDNAAITD